MAIRYRGPLSSQEEEIIIKKYAQLYKFMLGRRRLTPMTIKNRKKKMARDWEIQSAAWVGV